MEEIKLVLSLNDINVIIKSLSKEAFKDVYELIGKINYQANNQLDGEQEE